ncbi:MAG: ShlB/FhaC/HecB family hemolysin secretion/activation protein [Pseudomonadota bacterium]
MTAPRCALRVSLAALLLLTQAASVAAQTPVPDLSQDYADQLQLQTIWVESITLEDNTLLEQRQVDTVLAGYTGRQVSFEELLAARDALTRLYVAAGYINSGVLIGDQKVTDGQVVMTAVEGRLGEIRLRGNRWLNDRRLEAVFRHGLGDTLQVGDLEASLRDMQRRPMIRRVNAELVPSAQRGISDLELAVEERAPVRLSFDTNNHRAPSVGEYQGVLAFSHQSLTGREDTLQASYALGDGVDDVGLAYSLPLTRGDLRGEVYYRRGNSDIVEAGFDELDITSDIETWGVAFRQPALRGESQEVTLGLGFENLKAESTLLGEPFSFSAGEIDGGSEVSLLRGSLEWVWGSERDALALYTAVNVGVDWLGSSDARDIPGLMPGAASGIPDSEFTSLIAQVNYVRQLPWAGARALLSLTWQHSDDPLLPTLKMVVGGVATVRGYRENQLVRDKGLVARGELRFPLFSDNDTLAPWGLQFAPFLDYGRGEDNAISLPGFEDPAEDELASIGAGLLLTGYAPLALGIYYGEPLIDASTNGDSLQERGWHVRATFSWSLPSLP